MGLGILVDAPIRGRGILRRKPSPDALLDDLERAFRAGLSDQPLLAKHARFSRGDGILEVVVHPATEAIELRCEDERIVCSAKTNPAGPGYHAYVVELLERIGEIASIEWRWRDEDGDLGDECGFHESRDFAALQREMLAWLRALCGTLRENAGGYSVCLPLWFVPDLDGRVCGPLGPLDPSWIAEVAEADDVRLAQLGAAFFPWWGRPLDARFWDGYGRALAWVNVPWHVAADDEEAALYDAVLDAFARARELDPTIALPEREIEELRQLRDQDADPDRVPSPDGIGYQRGPMTWPLTGEWSMPGPGHWYMRQDDGTIVRWFGDREIHVTTFRVEATQEDLLRDCAAADVSWEREHLRGAGQLTWKDDGDHWMLQGKIAADNALCIVTIVFVNEDDRAWAEETFRSIRR